MIKSLFLVALCLSTSIVYAAKEPPVPVRTVSPSCPPNLRTTSGIVTLKCAISEQGDVTSVEVMKSSNDGFNDAATSAIKKWKFKPAHEDGKAVSITVTLPIKFASE